MRVRRRLFTGIVAGIFALGGSSGPGFARRTGPGNRCRRRWPWPEPGPPACR